jgi:hypothetical protein
MSWTRTRHTFLYVRRTAHVIDSNKETCCTRMRHVQEREQLRGRP